MHVLFLHHNFPAQFGQIAMYLARSRGYSCTFVSEQPSSWIPEIHQIQYQPAGGARHENHYCSRTFENQVWRSHAAYEALRARPDIKPDLIVAHSGFVSSLYLRDLYPDVPHVGYFELFYHIQESDLHFRHDLPSPPQMDALRARTRNAILLLDLHNCDAGYTPTNYQRSRLPSEFLSKVNTIFDGIDVQFWSPATTPVTTIGELSIPKDVKVVTYVSRGLEAMRGFDIFLQAADRLCRRRSDVVVLVVGEDRVAYGGDLRFTNNQTFKSWVIDKYRPDLSRIHFLGRVPPAQLVQIFARSNVHCYLTAPFVLSWSLLNAMSCGKTVIASDTAPVRELIEHEKNGLLVDFFDVDRWVESISNVLEDDALGSRIGKSAREKIVNDYNIEKSLNQMVELYERVTTTR